MRPVKRITQSETQKTESVSFIRITVTALLLLSAAGIGVLAIKQYRDMATIFTEAAIALFLVATAVNPLAFSQPRRSYDWKVIPRCAKILQGASMLLIVLAAIAGSQHIT